MKAYGGVEVECQISQTPHQMDDSGQLHAPANLTSRKPAVPIASEAEWNPGPVWTPQRYRENRIKMSFRKSNPGSSSPVI
jgi:hypothetical protein